MKNILRIHYLLIIFCMVAIQENHTEPSNNNRRKTRKYTSQSQLKRKRGKKNKKNKKSQTRLTNVNIRKPEELIQAAEQNLNKSLEEKDPKLVLEEGTRYLNKLTFDTSEETGVTIGKYNISTKDVSKEDLKFIEENLNKLTIIALYDAVTVQGKLWINAISELVPQDVHDEIIASNEREARKALELGKNFSILRENKELIKQMILAVLKNIFEENEGNSKKGFLGRSWDKLVGNADTPMKAFINFIDKNPLILELNKLPEDEKEELKYYACLTALHLNDKSSFFNDIPASKFFAKMVGGLSYLPLDPKKTKNELAEQTVKINTYDKKNCKELFTWLFNMAGASKPKLQIVPKTEFCLDSTLSARMLTLVGGGLAIAGTTAAVIGYRGYKNPENKGLNLWNTLKNQATRDITSIKGLAEEIFKNAGNYFKKKNSLQTQANNNNKEEEISESNNSKPSIIIEENQNTEEAKKFQESPVEKSNKDKKDLNDYIKRINSQASENLSYKKTDEADKKNEEEEKISESKIKEPLIIIEESPVEKSNKEKDKEKDLYDAINGIYQGPIKNLSYSKTQADNNNEEEEISEETKEKFDKILKKFKKAQ